MNPVSTGTNTGRVLILPWKMRRCERGTSLSQAAASTLRSMRPTPAIVPTISGSELVLVRKLSPIPIYQLLERPMPKSFLHAKDSRRQQLMKDELRN